MSEEQTLRQVEQQLLAARPWDAAEPQSLWSITGRYPQGGGFERCLAVVLPGYVSGSDRPVFAFLPPLGMVPPSVVEPAWITHATPLLIVHRDEPTQTYYDDDQEWI